MGFGFNLFMILFVVPLSAILLITWFVTRKHHWGKIIGFLWLGLLAMVLLISGLNWILGKPNLEKDDYCGQYIVDRSYFSGKQADWQYNHFRFEIKDNDSIYFYVTEKEKIIQTYIGKIRVTENYVSEHLLINMSQPTHHILSSNPTTYRHSWDFHLVFYSPKFNNLYFKKGEWEIIDSN
ncbi:hypothetical protein [Flectobacillus roseus]|uniref:DUF4178 domain-containing protein n=1 Tax=Flectobacillus roseus TaxID=502259 RepID=A0ABT6Y8Z6_9BACT|nr:hypothetical protein [Flectobacillus roseus]MDI9859977.1 hypothetical protein [Flectobacillus roseus]